MEEVQARGAAWTGVANPHSAVRWDGGYDHARLRAVGLDTSPRMLSPADASVARCGRLASFSAAQ